MILNIITIVIVIIAVIIILVMYQRVPRCEECRVCPDPSLAKASFGLELVNGNVELDIQFSENNKPSKVLDNMFKGRNVYLGGYSLDF